MKKIERYVLEKRIYEFLGIYYFKKLVFILEKIIHYRDKGQNINYHIKGYYSDSAEVFIKYLFYNGSIHFRNIIFFILYVVIKALFFSFAWYDFVFFLLAIKDMYCIMLQRYNYLRIFIFQYNKNKMRQRHIEKVVKEKSVYLLEEEYTCEKIEEDLQLIAELRKAIKEDKIVFIGEKESASLQRWCNLLKRRKGEKI